jgi:ketosteroid isomerase-like protein
MEVPMPSTPSAADPVSVVERLITATNAHDVDAITACFAPGYVNETPVHPARGFTGRDQVRQNWTMILGAVPDVRAEVLGLAVDHDTVWTEQEHRGTRPDGSPHVMRGVVIFGIADDLISSARFYLEPLDESDQGVGAVIRQQLDDSRPGPRP